MNHYQFPMSDDPTPGETLVLPVASSATRTTLFPEMVPVVSMGPDALELVLLRNEIVFTASHGHVYQEDDETKVRMELAPPITQMVDLGHVRLAVSTATDMSIALLNHLVAHHGLQREDILGRLQAS